MTTLHNPATPDAESDPIGCISWLSEQFAELNERLRVHATVIRDLITENQRLHDRIVTLEAAGRSARDQNEPAVVLH
jgi:hypothetical protein